MTSSARGASPGDSSGNSSGAESGGAPTARRMILGAWLRKLREEMGITRAAAGEQIRGSESKMSRLELGRVGFKKRDVLDLLTVYGVHDPDERKMYEDMVDQCNQPGWWQGYTEVIPSWFSAYVGLEEVASRIQSFELQFVPGLLQTEDYARAVVCNARSGMTEGEIDERVALRVRRQKLLARPDAPRFWCVIDESVLHRPIGGRKVLRGQIDALLELTTMPHITLQVLPYDRSGQAVEGAFSLLRFAEPELPDVAYVEYLTGAHYIERLDELEVYARALDRLAVDAETPEQSRQMLSKVRVQT
ncbi:Helix-turn-helix domain-containing protein [Haloechinothrix alba]|uniref:Helix-turn-helix domain-containing protein n=2 Tax=Haloechinothrix alba TaxID=664784 RepID=A0A238YBW9_9PSEU|nr:Helix-turn-helix domain-containing protein [Haloechinothrix alba]